MTLSITRRVRAALALAIALFVAPAAARAVLLTVTSDQNDYKILYGLGYYLTIDPFQLVGFIDTADFSGMTAGEPVWLIAHGSVGEIGGKTSGDLLTLFTLRGLPAFTETVYVFSCEAGSVTTKNPESLVGQLGRSMSGGNWPRVHVTGPIGCGIPDARLGLPNSQRVVVNGQEGKVLSLQYTLEQKYRPEQALVAYIQNYQRTHNGQSPPLHAKAVFAYNSPEISGFYRELVDECARQRLIYGQGVSFRTVP
jgi:hypothetical protein